MQIFSIVAHRLTLSTLDVEATHSRHRHLRRASHSTSSETLSAEACLQEASLVMKAVQKPSVKSKRMVQIRVRARRARSPVGGP